ncbi:MAG TPA: VOC family protein [Candidatus Acidoferrales bacterium]|jgi:predicted enzyme related to lactoylglutathione lyase|nr:VOC family protein [Candidatus Acidoferrales bacterium]
MSAKAAASIAVTGLDAVYYLAKDFKRGVAFYRDVLGLPVSMETERNVEFDLGDGNSFGVSFMPDVWYPGGGAIFAVSDLDAAVQRLKDAGVKFYTDGAIESPVCRIAWCEDSEGNTFAIHKRK